MNHLYPWLLVAAVLIASVLLGRLQSEKPIKTRPILVVIVSMAGGAFLFAMAEYFLRH